MNTVTANLQAAVDFYADGVKSMQQGDLHGAILFWNQALRFYPDYVDALENRGAARRMLGDLQGALSDVNAALSLNPDRMIAYWVRGDIYATQGNFELAINDYHYLAQNHANQIPIAVVHDSLEKWHAMLELRHQTPDPIKGLQSAPSLEPTSSSQLVVTEPAHNYVAQDSLFIDSEKDVVDATFRSLRPIDLVYHAQKLIRAGKHREALSELSSAIEQDSTLIEAYIERGALYTTLAATLKAQIDLDRALVFRPNHVLALSHRANVEIVAGKMQQALPFLQRAIEADAKDALVHNIYGALYEAEGKFGEAFAAYNYAVTLDPSNVLAFTNRGRMYMKYQLPRKALPDFLRSLQLQPTNARAHINVGQIYVGRGEFDEASKYFEQAAELGYESARQTLTEIRSRPLPPIRLSPTTEWQPTTAELLADALLRVSAFVYGCCGPCCWQEQIAKKSLMGLTTKSVNELRHRWNVSMETSTEIDNRRLARTVQAAVLDLLQSPAALLRIEVVDSKTYALSFWSERPVPGAKGPIFNARPEDRISIPVNELTPTLHQLIEQQVLVIHNHTLRYMGQTLQGLN